jgi:sulfopyruvate decarboxylase TPP-binding subunit
MDSIDKLSSLLTLYRVPCSLCISLKGYEPG